MLPISDLTEKKWQGERLTVQSLLYKDLRRGDLMAEDKGTNSVDKAKANSDDEEAKWTYKDWYERNKERLAERRKIKYHSDKKHRKKVLEQNREWRASKAKERDEKPKPKVRIPKHRKPIEMMVQINGTTEEASLVHIGTFARIIGRSVPTIHQWERLGLLPRTPYLLRSRSKQERLYTEEMIRVVKKALSTRGPTISSADSTFREEIVEGWETAGVVVVEE